MNGNINCIAGIILILLSTNISAQVFEPELPLIPDKPGTFQILSRTDYANPDCGFKKTEMTANLQEITEVVNTIRMNPVLIELRGFDGRARIYDASCKDQGGYGIPSRISFEFASWYRKKDGTATRGFIEPPEWSVIINKLKPNSIWGFLIDDFAGDPNLYVVPAKKELEKGIDVYNGDECYVIYNPDRPPYWLPVTIKEAFTALIEKCKTYNQTTRDFLLGNIENEYAAIPEQNRNNPAYYISESFSHISTNSGNAQIVRANPEYWDKSLPKSAIQFIYFRSVPNKDYLRKLKEEYLQNNSISYNLARFEESFDIKDIRALVPLIGK
jgi:hypothetical protein